jgi:chaperonin cofactor prefoldin
MQGLNNDLESFKQKCSSLDNQNMSLRAQVQQLQAQLANKSGIKEPNV